MVGYVGSINSSQIRCIVKGTLQREEKVSKVNEKSRIRKKEKLSE
jgi:hypothetical protein